jgi:hypothetical protein
MDTTAQTQYNQTPPDITQKLHHPQHSLKQITTPHYNLLQQIANNPEQVDKYNSRGVIQLPGVGCIGSRPNTYRIYLLIIMPLLYVY